MADQTNRLIGMALEQRVAGTRVPFLDKDKPNIRKIKIKLGRTIPIVYNNFADTASASQKGRLF